jgi:rSAM/selenodomain-associated transferase 1
MTHTRALILFAKQPLAGRVKTRLTPPLPAQWAAELYDCMLRDTITRARRLDGVRLCIYYQDDAGAGDCFARLAPGVESRPQRGADLGERMADAFAALFREGHERVAIIGSDSPDLPADHIRRAYELLDNGADAVFGPSEDGGYCLLALGSLHRELFENLPWSEPRLLEESLERAASAGIATTLLPPWYDLDTCADLRRALEQGGLPAAPLTDGFLRTRLAPSGLLRRFDIEPAGDIQTS